MQQDKQNSFIDLFENEQFIQQGADNQYNKFMLKVPAAIYSHPNFYYYPFTMPEQVNYQQLPLISTQQIQDSNKQQQQQGKKQKKSDKAIQKIEEKSSNLKNTYINKISTLINSEQKSNELLEKCKQHIKSGDTKGSKIKGNEESEKLARNRECARNSRKRKKVYIELLESKVKQMTDELSQIKKDNEQNLNPISDFQDENVQNFFIMKDQILERLLNDQNQNQDLMNNSADQYNEINRIKKKAIYGLLKEMINVSVPIHQRYLMFSKTIGQYLIQLGEAMFSRDQVNQVLDCQDRQWEKDLLSQLNITEEQQQKIHQLQGNMHQELSKFKKHRLKTNTVQFCQDLYKASKEMQNLSNYTIQELDDNQKLNLLVSFKQQQNLDCLSMANLCNLKNNNDD